VIQFKSGKKVLPLTLAMMMLLLPLFLPAAGCAPGETPAPPPAAEKDDAALPPAEAEPQTVILYFADEQADRLVREERQFVLAGRERAVAVLEELIEGPAYPAHGRTIPPDVKVLGVKIAGGIADADFSKELRSSHWGGSTGEIFTVYSIVHTLAELPGVELVQIRIEGEIVETLVGHLELREPLSPDPGLVAP